MNQIYIVIAYGGSYDAWENNLFARYTMEDAELAIIELKERDARITAAMPKLIAQLKELQSKFPLTQEPHPAMPKGPAKQTRENRDAHQKAMATWSTENQRIWAINQARQNHWNEEMTNYQRAFAKNECGLSDEDMVIITFPTHSGYCFGDRGEYRIDELEIK